MTAPWDGRPQEPERDGWHVLRGIKFSYYDAWEWSAKRQAWDCCELLEIAKDFEYIGPVPTKEYLVARDAATIERCAVACDKEAEEFGDAGNMQAAIGAVFAGKAVRALKTQEAK